MNRRQTLNRALEHAYLHDDIPRVLHLLQCGSQPSEDLLRDALDENNTGFFDALIEACRVPLPGWFVAGMKQIHCIHPDDKPRFNALAVQYELEL